MCGGIVLGVVLSGCGWAPEGEHAADDPPVPVRAMRLQRTAIKPGLDLMGTLVAIPEQTAVLSSKVDGWVERVATVEGAVVKAGDVVVTLDTRLAQVELARAEAALAEKKAALARLRRGYLPQEIAMAREELRRAEQEAAARRAELDALTPLWRRKETPEVQYQKARAALLAAEAAVQAARSKVQLYEAGTPAEEIAEAEAQVAAAQADADAARLELDLCRITTPIGGMVMQLTARQGMFVSRATQLAVVTDVSSLFVRVRVPGDYIAQLRPGANADVRVGAYPQVTLPGIVARLSGQADPTTGDVVGMVKINGRSDLMLRPGMTARAHVWLPELPDVLVAPVSAIADRDGVAVATVVRDGKAYEVEIRTGVKTADQVEITSGLQEGDWVVTEGGYALPDGCPVKILDGNANSEGKVRKEQKL